MFGQYTSDEDRSQLCHDSLAAKVKAVNTANAYAKELYPILQEVFRPFVGKKIKKETGGLMKKVQDAIEALNLPCTPTLHVYKCSYDGYTLSYNVKVCVCYGDQSDRGWSAGNHYYESSVAVGKMDSGVLVALDDRAPNGRTDYTVDEILRQRETYKKLKEAADNAWGDLSTFGEH